MAVGTWLPDMIKPLLLFSKDMDFACSRRATACSFASVGGLDGDDVLVPPAHEISPSATFPPHTDLDPAHILISEHQVQETVVTGVLDLWRPKEVIPATQTGFTARAALQSCTLSLAYSTICKLVSIRAFIRAIFYLGCHFKSQQEGSML